MTTANTIIADALTEIGVKEVGQAIPAEESAIALRMLNRTLGRWAHQRLSFSVLTTVSIPLDGSASYSIGPTGDVVSARPVKVNAARATIAGIESSVNVLGRTAWDAIGVKDVVGGVVSDVWYSSSVPDGVLYVYPRATSGALEIDCQVLATSFPDLVADVDLPEGYDDALTLEIAVALCSAYSISPPPELVTRRNSAVRVIKRTNSEPIDCPHELSSGRGYEIERGY